MAEEQKTHVDPTADTMPSDGGASAAPADPLVGVTLGHFRIDGVVGRGGMGAVYRAWDTSLERPVALKTLLFDSPPSRARFLREARAQAQLRHPHVVPIHFVGEANVGAGTLTYLVMDFVEGESLAGLLDRRRILSEDHALDIVDAVAQALEVAHARGLMHRDIKPSNILVEPGGRVLLADFGLAKTLVVRSGSDGPPSSGPSSDETPPSVSGAQLTHAGAIVGTPTYLAPEQAEGGKSVDHRADIYALGVTLYELLVGEPPFTAPTRTGVIEQHKAHDVLSPRLLVPELRPDVERLVMRMLEKQPEKRFATYAELRQAVAAARARHFVDATFFARAAAFAIDFLLFSIVAALLAKVTLRALLFPFSAVFLGLVEGRWGTTPGKRLMGLATIDRYGTKLPLGQSLARAFVKLGGPILIALYDAVAFPGWIGRVPPVVLGVAWVAGLALALGREHRALHDIVTRTRVVIAARAAGTPKTA